MCITGNEDEAFYQIIDSVRAVLATRFSPDASSRAMDRLELEVRTFDRLFKKDTELDQFLSGGSRTEGW